MSKNKENVWRRRVRNLPHTGRNIGRMLWHPLHNIGRMLWHPLRNILILIYHSLRSVFLLLLNVLLLLWYSLKSFVYFLLGKQFDPAKTKQIGSSWPEPEYQALPERNVLILLLCLPASILFVFKDFSWVRKLLFPVLPKLGMFFQHEAFPIANFTCPDKPDTGDLKLAVITPSYGQAEFIERTINSVLEQDYPHVSYVVQDGASNDATVDILKQYPEGEIIWESVKDKGQTDALNKGVKKLGAWDIMCYLNSDDLLLPGAIHTVMNYFAEHPEIDVVYGNRLMIDDNDDCIGEWILHGHDNFVLSFADYIPQETMFWRRSIWDKVGGKFDDSFRFAMDWDLILRFRKAGANFHHISEFLAAFRIHEAQKTQAMINEIGEAEMGVLRERELGYRPSQAETYGNVLPFLVRHVIADIKFRYFSGKETSSINCP